MALDLILGPANAGKVADLYRRYLEHLDGGGAGLLVVPDRDAVARAERELLARRGTVIGGSVVTFDGVFRRVVERAGRRRRLLHPARRRLLLARLVATAPLDVLQASARGPRFAESLGRLFDRLGSALVDPQRLAASATDPAAAELAGLYAAWWDELDRQGSSDAARQRILACDLLERSLEAWDGSALFAQGFDDLAPAQETLLLRVADRAAATLTLPYEPGRAAFAVLRPVVARLAARARTTELAPLPGTRPLRLAALERALFEPAAEPVDGAIGAGGGSDGTIVAAEAGGGRAEAEIVLELVCEALREGVPPERIAVVAPRDPGRRPALAETLAAARVPFDAGRPPTVGRTGFGHALGALAGFALGREPSRAQLFAFLRSPWSGVPRRRVDFVEGRLRGGAIAGGEAAYRTTVELLGSPVAAVEALRAADDVRAALASAVRAMVAASTGLAGRTPAGALAGDVLAARAALDALDALGGLAEPAGADELLAAMLRARLPDRRGPAGRVLLRDARDARGLDVDVAIVLGLEHGGFGGAPTEDAFLADDQRAALAEALAEPAPGDVDRHLLYMALTRARRRLVLVRRVADDGGRPLEPAALLADVERAAGGVEVVRRRGLGDVTFGVDEAPTPRERARAVVRLAAREPARAARIADADERLRRRLDRATRAFDRRTRLRDPRILAQLAALDRFPVTSLERFGDCSAWWFVERHLDPREIDATYDARLQGQIGHTVLQRFFKLVPSRLGAERLLPEHAEAAVALMRELVAEAVSEQRLPSDTLAAKVVARKLARDLERFVRRECAQPSPLAATRFEVAFGLRTSAPGLKDGLKVGDFAVSGKIDRIDTDPGFSARGLVQDYKTGVRAHSAAEIRREGRLQIPLYVLAARELLGIEPLGGLYRALGGGGATRGMVSADDADVLPPGLAPTDLLDRDALWAIVDDACGQATEAVGRIRTGDIRHDPRGGHCPEYCPWSGVCRIER